MLEWIPSRDMPPFLRNGKISTRDINKQIEDEWFLQYISRRNLPAWQGSTERRRVH